MGTAAQPGNNVNGWHSQFCQLLWVSVGSEEKGTGSALFNINIEAGMTLQLPTAYYTRSRNDAVGCN